MQSTKERVLAQLEGYKDIKADICRVTSQIANLRAEHDSVKGSLPYSPYTLTQFSIKGINQQTLARLYRRRQRLERRKKAIDAYINAIPDRMVRCIVTLRYAEGLTWKKIAKAMGGGNTSDGVRMAINRYFSTACDK